MPGADIDVTLANRSSHNPLPEPATLGQAPPSPSRRQRAIAALVLGLVAGGYVAFQFHRFPPGTEADFNLWWDGARALLAGQEPYAATPRTRLGYPLFYPLPALLVLTPLALLPLAVARSVFFGLGTALFAYALSSRGWWALLAIISAPMLNASQSQQWAPLLVGAIMLPALSWLVSVKPSLGLALLAGWGTRRSFLGIAALWGLSLLIDPGWVPHWLAAAREAPHRPLLWVPAGTCLLVALLRWRRPEARMLALLACVPSTGFPYEWIPLFLIPQSLRQMALLVGLADLAFLPMLMVTPGTPYDHISLTMTLVGLLTVYIPALILVLQRPNVAPGATPLHAALGNSSAPSSEPWPWWVLVLGGLILAVGAYHQLTAAATEGWGMPASLRLLEHELKRAANVVGILFAAGLIIAGIQRASR
jgi:hypothetical protein